MNTKKVILAAALVCAFATPAFADEMTVGNNYASLSGGVIMPEDINGSAGGTNVKLSFKSGYTVSGAIGTWVADQVTLEGEVTYLAADFDKGEALGLSVPIDGDFTSTLVMANGAFHFMGKNATFDPYVGAGVGAAFSKIKIDSIGGIPLGQSDTGTDVAAQASAGIALSLASGITLGAEYRYLYIDSGDDDTDGFSGHNLTASLTFAF